mmetsp:Transcript_9745/g.9497  ORF Transcript_9745/g.9497 Transcript_9745/m.9497 type:complete len:105 (+) Transcript_9745:79-393(+)|eukprot:CAMPEP_0170545056 /NCGR_PEP_ID=MMETSP0211-20121228/3587_1 /TAXON_ID=311385 /ORGANISM="Pseudokeronopsis sp., Strain OXSARD2" /LENGTH=104 /DNA_ID=CAMNT_0010848859 /DNA_START=78 /DNA_END=392 /DNA_ORIENTATION=+
MKPSLHYQSSRGIMQTNSFGGMRTIESMYLEKHMSQMPMRKFSGKEDEEDKDSDADFQSKSKTDGQDKDQYHKQFDEWIQNNDIVLFMKGNRKMPRCGFSNYVI